jgi:hypothetical protein
MNPLEDMIQVRHHTSAEIEPSDSVKRNELDAERGPTTAASGEVAANLPLLRARNALRERDASPEEWATADARDCPDWVEVWCAHLCCGADGNPRTSGVTRWGIFGNFTEIADEMKERRADESEFESEAESEFVKTGSGAQESGEQPDSLEPSPDDIGEEHGSGGGEGRSECDTNHHTESRFTFTHEKVSEESCFTFRKYG